MRRLSAEDAGFLCLELDVQPMTCVAVLVLEASPTPLDRERFRAHFAERLGALPAFRWRVYGVPLGLGLPVVVQDAGFDLTNHLDERTLPGPGSDAELDRLCAALAEERLDRRRPLWDATLVHGLAGGRQAIVLRIHHCLMDGVGLVATFEAILSDLPASDSWRPERRPRRPRLLIDGMAHQGRQLRSLRRLVAETRRCQEAAAQAVAALPCPPPAMNDAPATVMNRGYTATRSFARAELPLADLRLLKDVAGVTLNDAALAVLAGAVRGYLLARDELPSQPLIASVPVSLDPVGAATRSFGNRVNTMAISLFTDEVDPWTRLERIHAGSRQAKAVFALQGPHLLGEWLAMVPPAVLSHLTRRGVRTRRGHPDRPSTSGNVVLSNPRGLDGVRRFAAIPVESLCLAGPPNNGIGANVLVLAYGDTVHAGILCFADSVPDAAELAAGLRRSLAELLHLARSRQARSRTG